MTLALDSSILIDIQNRFPATLKQMQELIQEHPATPRLTFMNRVEFLLGLQNKNPKNKQSGLAFLDAFVTVHTTNQTADILARLKRKYDSEGKHVPLADLLSASIAIENNLVFITRDTDFSRIDELQKVIL